MLIKESREELRAAISLNLRRWARKFVPPLKPTIREYINGLNYQNHWSEDVRCQQTLLCRGWVLCSRCGINNTRTGADDVCENSGDHWLRAVDYISLLYHVVMTISEVPAQSSTASLKEIEETERNQGISGSARSKVHAHEYLETTVNIILENSWINIATLNDEPKSPIPADCSWALYLASEHHLLYYIVHRSCTLW